MPIAPVIASIWIGFVCSISFMEAWLKFRAALMTRAIGLSVGKVIFSALNKMEWVFASFIGLYSLIGAERVGSLFFTPLLILVIQTFWLLPAMNERVDFVLQGKELSRSRLHIYYISLEVIKVCCLLLWVLR